MTCNFLAFSTHCGVHPSPSPHPSPRPTIIRVSFPAQFSFIEMEIHSTEGATSGMKPNVQLKSVWNPVPFLFCVLRLEASITALCFVISSPPSCIYSSLYSLSIFLSLCHRRTCSSWSWETCSSTWAWRCGAVPWSTSPSRACALPMCQCLWWPSPSSPSCC